MSLKPASSWPVSVCRAAHEWDGRGTENEKHQDTKHRSDRLCVRTFGPHLPVVDRHGEEVFPSKKGHPLGPNRALHLPARLLEIDDYDFEDGR